MLEGSDPQLSRTDSASSPLKRQKSGKEYRFSTLHETASSAATVRQQGLCHYSCIYTMYAKVFLTTQFT